MYVRYRYRVYPATTQREALARSFGCARVVFNDGLRIRLQSRANGGKCISDGELSKQVEDLCVVGLGRTRLAKSVHDAGWAQFTSMLAYKAARYGRTFARVDRFFPSTRMCSDCGRINDKMALDVRAWDCPCGSHHDRDVNAAKNMKAAGQADFNDRGAQIRPGLVPAPRGEAVTHPNAACSTRSMEGISVLQLQGEEDVNGTTWLP